jgi:hypothetical protein
MKIIKENFDVVVVGGGLAGFCAAVEAARHGAKVALVQNRPVFGGNSSSEIGVTPHGAAAFHAYARESGIISELLIEERATNHAEVYENGWTNSVWDLVMYNMAIRTENLTLYMNTDFSDVILQGSESGRDELAVAEDADVSFGYYHRAATNIDRTPIAAVIARTQNAEVELHLYAQQFIDCTGDGLVADRAGCEWRMGSEGKAEFNEPHAPDSSSCDTMGSSIHFRTKDLGRPVPFEAPDWAVKYEDPAYFYDNGRLPKEERGGFWWLEIGVPYHTIHDNEDIRHKLTSHTLGVWDWMKNRDPKMMERTKNYAIDWIGQVPGKRESRRIVGEYFMTEHDVLEKTAFEDEVAFGGWFVDLHTPGGLLAESAEPSNAEHYNTFTEYAVMSYCGPYGIPLRSLIAKDVPNLSMAGRNISCTHAALGTMRVMSTTALMGQAVGLAAAICVETGARLAETTSGDTIQLIQQTLLREGCFSNTAPRADADDLSQQAQVSAESEWHVSGAGPESRGAHEGLAVWRDQPQYNRERMEVGKAQLIAVGNEGIDYIELCVSNDGDESQLLELNLQAVEHIWDYRVQTGSTLAVESIEVSPGRQKWIRWKLNLSPDQLPDPGSFVRVAVSANPNIEWHVAGRILPGQLGVYQIGENRYRRFDNGATLSYRISPAQSCYPPLNTLRGATRPHRHTNMWASDPNQVLPQSLNLRWNQAVSLTQVELSFPGHIIREYHAYAPFYRDQQCPKDYRIEVRIDSEWQSIVEIRGNYQRKRVHSFDAVTTDELRVVVEATNGDPSAQIYEIRCY